MSLHTTVRFDSCAAPPISRSVDTTSVTHLAVQAKLPQRSCQVKPELQAADDGLGDGWRGLTFSGGGGKSINVIDAHTLQTAWTMDMDLGVRPMAFNTNPDGSTKWIFVQVSGFNGFAVVDFAIRKEIKRIKNPDLPPGKSIVTAGSDPSHGMAVTSDGKTLVVCSRINNYLYSYSLPDLNDVGGAELGGKGAGWVTLAPDGKTAYVANPVTNDVSVVDVASMKETSRIKVGFVPKRNVTVMLQ